MSMVNLIDVTRGDQLNWNLFQNPSSSEFASGWDKIDGQDLDMEIIPECRNENLV